LNRKLLAIITILFTVSLSTYYYLWYSDPLNSVTESPYLTPTIIKRMQIMVDDTPEELPNELRSITIARGEFPSWFRLAKGHTTETLFEFVTYQLVYDVGYSIIDPVHSKALHDTMIWAYDYDEEAYNKMQKSLEKAHQIYFTHEHWDHFAGAFNTELFDKIKHVIYVSKAQRNSDMMASMKDGFISLSQLDKVNVIDNKGLYKISPGVVLFNVPGHTPGNQGMYIKLKNGTEILLVGDIAYSMANITLEVGKPRISSHIILGEDSEAVNSQIKSLIRIKNEFPNIHIVPAHDIPNNRKLVEQGIIKKGLH